MAKKKDDGFKLTRIAYAGARFHDGKLSDEFVIVTAEGDKPIEKDRLSYSVNKKGYGFAIGQMYDVEINDKYTAWLNTAEPTDYHVDSKQIGEWSAHDAAARHAKHVFGTRKRLEKERRGAWLDGMESLRLEYRNMSFAERRAMRQLVLEWLEEQ